jgi:hypothetical protein
MDIKISIEELRKRKIFLATPMYAGQCSGMFTRSVQDLSVECAKMGIHLNSYYLFNESLITRARNYCVDAFLRSDCTHLLFIDSDIGFMAKDVITMLALQSDDSPYDIIGGPYQKKNISWEKIKLAVDKGAADENPTNLENFVGDFVFNPVITGGQTTIKLDEPAEVLEIGTGFMLIRRDAFSKYKAAFPNIDYRPDHARSEDFDGSREIGMYFQAEIDPASRRYLSEDYLFCQNMRKAGGKVWLCPWIQLQHVGSYVFGGSLAALSSIGANATADPNLMAKRKPK